MTEEEKQQLRLALAIVSGREDCTYISPRKAIILNITNVDWSQPNVSNTFKIRAEEIVFDWIVSAHMKAEVE